MKILLVHNFYKQAGGEDVVFANEAALLREYGHEVIEYTARNDEIDHLNKVAASVQTVWSAHSKQALAGVIAKERPAVMHVHNWFMRLSPSIYAAAREQSVPVVQTLHNYRLMCPAAIFYRDGHVCEDCMGKAFALPAVKHACYRESKLASAVVAGTLTIHRARGTWKNGVDRYIALTDFARQKFIEGGLPADKITVKPNFLQQDPGSGQRQGGYFLFIGRLTPEKGILRLVDAWRELDASIPLKILGEGPEENAVREKIAAYGLKNVEMLGQQPRAETLRLLRDAYALVQASEWYEGFPMTLVEAMACGVPVVAGNLGAMSTVIRDGVNGLHFAPGDSVDLARAVRQLWSDAAGAQKMAAAARAEYDAKYTASRNYDMLKSIYDALVGVPVSSQS